MKPIHTLLLFTIIALAAFLRLYRLSVIPPGVNRDEASIGFTAYSLLQTGKDEYGRTFPLSFESFGDWKLPLYIYTTIPFVSLFGLSELAVRLPSAMAGILTIATLFVLVRILFQSIPLALLSSFILTVSPWHIHISRVESESNVAILFITLGTILFLRALSHKRTLWLAFSGIFFAATYYTYHGNHIFTTLYAAGLLILYRKEVFQVPRWIVAAIVPLFLVTIILLFTLFSANKTKISGIGIFGNPTVIHERIELPRLVHGDPSSLFTRIIHNKPVYAFVTMSQNFLKSYSPEFLFIKGGTNHAHNIEEYANMHLFESVFLVLGASLVLTSIKKRPFALILWWILVAGVAPAITKDAPHSNRMFIVTPALAITVALGMQYASSLIHAKWKFFLPIIVGILYLGSLFVYADAYLIHFPKTEARFWGAGYKRLTAFLSKPEYRDKEIIMTSPQESPYIYLLFYGNEDPTAYQRSAVRYPVSRDGFTDVAGFGRFSFRPIDWGRDVSIPNRLLVSSPDEIPKDIQKNARFTKTNIFLRDGQIQFTVIQTL